MRPSHHHQVHLDRPRQHQHPHPVGAQWIPLLRQAAQRLHQRGQRRRDGVEVARLDNEVPVRPLVGSALGPRPDQAHVDHRRMLFQKRRDAVVEATARITSRQV